MPIIYKNKYFKGILVFSGLWTGVAFSTSVDQLGISPGDLATGHARVADPSPETAAYLNPAGLVSGHGSASTMSFYQSQIELKRLEVPKNNEPLLLTDTGVSEVEEPISGVNFGYQSKLGVGGYFGLAGSVPEGFLRMYGGSGEDPSYLHYNDRSRKPELYAALAFPLRYGLSIGLGVYMNLSASGELQVGLEPSESRGRIGLSTEPVIVPYGGFRWVTPEFMEGKLALGVFYRKGQTSDVDLSTDLTAGKSDSFQVPASIRSSLSAFHDPTIYRGGFAYYVSSVGFHFAYEVVDWSEYEEPTLVLSGEDITTLSGDVVEARRPLGRANNIKFGVTYEPRYILSTTLRAGIERRGSAVKDQDASPYIVDPERTVAGLGVSFNFDSPLTDSGRADTSFDFGYSYTALQRTSYDLNNGRRGSAGGYAHTVIGGFGGSF